MKVTPWTPIESGDVAAGAPDSAGLNMALRDNAKHCQGTLYDEDIHTAPTSGGHTHSSGDSSNVGRVYPNMPNLINFPYSREVSWWTLNGVTRSLAGYVFAAGGQWISLTLGDITRPTQSLSMFGAGAHLVISCYLKTDRALTSGEMQFGITTGGGGNSDDEKSFVVGGRMDVPFGLIDTGWRRFWAVVNTEGMEFSKSVRFTMQCSKSPLPMGGHITANLFCVQVGQVLDYMPLSYGMEVPLPGGVLVTSIGNQNWAEYGYAPTTGPPPVLDHAIAITNAIKLAVR